MWRRSRVGESISIPLTLTPETWRPFATQLQEILNRPDGAIFVWNRGCVTVPTNTTISGAEEIVFPSDFTGNGTLVLTIYDAEGGVNVALNGTELGSLSGTAEQEVLYEVAVTNLTEGRDALNSFKIWSTTGDSAELRKLEVYRNFAREQISDSAIWGNITGSGKPEDDATVGADFQTNLTNKPKDTFNLWADPQFELGSGALESLNAAHSLVTDPLSKFNGAIQLAGSTANKKSILITIPASAGQTIFTEWWAHKDGSVNSGADVGLTFRWVDGADEQISQTTDLQDESAMSTGAWTKFTGSSIAPANTATVGLRVENRTSHTAGNFFLSMVSFRSATPALWDDVSGGSKPADNATVGADATNLADDSVDADSVIAGTLSFKTTDLDTQVLTFPDGGNAQRSFDPTTAFDSIDHEVQISGEFEARSVNIAGSFAYTYVVWRQIDGGGFSSVNSADFDASPNAWETITITPFTDEPGPGSVEYKIAITRNESSSTDHDGEARNGTLTAKVIFFK